jgi:hypothetical protein
MHMSAGTLPCAAINASTASLGCLKVYRIRSNPSIWSRVGSGQRPRSWPLSSFAGPGISILAEYRSLDAAINQRLGLINQIAPRTICATYRDDVQVQNVANSCTVKRHLRACFCERQCISDYSRHIRIQRLQAGFARLINPGSW